MTDIAENLSLIGKKAYENATPFRTRTVVAVPDKSHVSIPIGDGETEDVPCLASYRNRNPGDKVWLVMTDERGWLVLGKIGPSDEDVLLARIEQLEAELRELRGFEDPETLPAPIPDIETPDISIDPVAHRHFEEDGSA